MMATEAIDARHEALVELHEAECALERGDALQAELHCRCAIGWLQEMAPSREFPDVEPLKAEA